MQLSLKFVITNNFLIILVIGIFTFFSILIILAFIKNLKLKKENQKLKNHFKDNFDGNFI